MIPIKIVDGRSGKKNVQSCCENTQSSCSQPVDTSTKIQLPLHFEAIEKKPEWVLSMVNTPAGQIPLVSPEWSKADRRGCLRSRLGAFRMSYSIQPGLYAIGSPDAGSDVFVSANYKLSFDVLRRSLDGLSGWILVLDTKGINVWCAAGKGTFGTNELIKQIINTGLAKIVSHRRIIVPQLGAVGVKAAEVKKETGFNILFGPVDAKDIKEYLNLKYKAYQEMRRVKFSVFKRLELTPIELYPALKRFLWAALIILLLFGFEPTGIIFRTAWLEGWPFLLLCFVSILTGAFIAPVLLPFIPFRSFAIKGIITGLTAAIPLVYFSPVFGYDSGFVKVSAVLLAATLSSYLALQFTGATTFTGISGVKKELKLALPLYIAGIAISVILIVIYKIKSWGII
ncbi:MAG: mercury methylation corrinoid protein HgcA [Spirochaetota bacterium]